MQIYAARNNQRRYCFFYIWFLCWYVIVLLPLNLTVFILLTDMARVNIQDKTVCQLTSANWIFGKIGKSSILQVSNNIILRPAGTVEQRILSYWSAWKHPPAYSVGHEKLISTPHWDLICHQYWTEQQMMNWRAGSCMNVCRNLILLQYLVAICCLVDRKYESLHRAQLCTRYS